MSSKTVKVPNISCGHCVHTIENEVSELEGITSVVADEQSKMVTVVWDEPQSWDKIAALLAEINYPAEN
jgi:copper chaperone CopZ